MLVTLTVFFCALPLVAQNKTETKAPLCSLPLDRAPELRGLRLGTPQSTVLARFPGTSVGKPDPLGVTKMRLSIIDTSAIPGMGRTNKGIQPDILGGNENSFILDNSKFPILKGVRRVRLEFTDAKLSAAEVSYDDAVKWDNVDAFVETVAKAMNLPTTWYLPRDADGSNGSRELECGSFLITATVGSDPSDGRIAAKLSVQDLTAAKLVEKRQNDLKDKAERDEEAKRKNFKP